MFSSKYTSMCPTQETAVSIWVPHQLVLSARSIVGKAYVRKLNKRSLLNILPVHDNKLPYEYSGSETKCSVCPLQCWSHLLVAHWWEIDDHPSISEWTDTWMIHLQKYSKRIKRSLINQWTGFMLHERLDMYNLFRD